MEPCWTRSAYLNVRGARSAPSSWSCTDIACLCTGIASRYLTKISAYDPEGHRSFEPHDERQRYQEVYLLSYKEGEADDLVMLCPFCTGQGGIASCCCHADTGAAVFCQRSADKGAHPQYPGATLWFPLLA